MGGVSLIRLGVRYGSVLGCVVVHGIVWSSVARCCDSYAIMVCGVGFSVGSFFLCPGMLLVLLLFAYEVLHSWHCSLAIGNFPAVL